MTMYKDAFGRFRTISLFVETVRPTKENLEPVFSLTDHGVKKGDKVFQSLKQIYLSYNHIPYAEYEFAIDQLGSWEHWEFLSQHRIVGTHIKKWREEMEIKIKADAIKELMLISRSGDKSAPSAARWLAERGYAPKATKGRPSKEEVEREKRIHAGITDTLDADMERLGLAVVNSRK